MSQSPIEFPKNAAQAEQGQRYITAWRALGSLLRRGGSWSGSERNLCFLNTHSLTFADVSAAAGFDTPADGRAIAAVDWDHDGDVDVWMTSRTGPRLRMLANNLGSKQHFLALRLHGVTCNRDAIGARIELYRSTSNDGRLVRTLRAGEGFLAQSSKWVHFGLGNDANVDHVVVQWPGGEKESFGSLSAGRRYTLVQGTGVARTSQPRRRVRELSANQAEAVVHASARIVPSWRMPLPPLKYLASDGQTATDLSGISTGPTLINLWASWCQPCVHELQQLSKQQSQLRDLGLTVVPLNVDGIDQNPRRLGEDARLLLDRLDVRLHSGIATKELADVLDTAHSVLVNHQLPLPVPSSFLLDDDGRLAVVYTGELLIDQLVHDVAHLNDSLHDVRDAAVPFAGRWATNPSPPDVLALPDALARADQANVALEYLESQFAQAEDLSAGVTQKQAANAFRQVAAVLLTEKAFGAAATAYRHSLRFEPSHWSAHLGLATALKAMGRYKEAISEHRVLLRLRPDHAATMNNLAWLLATCPDSSIRDANQAIELAVDLCRRSGFQSPRELDTLAASYAAAGRFKDAIAVARRAKELATSSRNNALALAVGIRLNLYTDRRSFVESE